MVEGAPTHAHLIRHTKNAIPKKRTPEDAKFSLFTSFWETSLFNECAFKKTTLFKRLFLGENDIECPFMF